MLFHRSYAEWNPVRMLPMAGNIGLAMVALFEAIMKVRADPEQGFRSYPDIHASLGEYGPDPSSRLRSAAMRSAPRPSDR